MEEKKFFSVRILWTLFLFVLIMIALVWRFFFAPSDFPVGEKIVIPEGKTLHEISVLLGKERVIKKPIFFDAYIRLMGEELNLKAGTYKFDSPLSVVRVAKKVIAGDYNIPLAKVTIREGLRRNEVTEILENEFVNFSREEFMNLTLNSEGKLFPDTYFLTEDASTQDIVEMINTNFIKRIESVLPRIETSKYNLNEVLTLASIVEKEVAKPEDRKIVAGILENRLEAGIPLQVDAVFEFILGKNTYELTRADLKYDSPYNTYLYRGLPPGPIASPGLDAIDAVLRPTHSDFIYYVSDREGNTYFAKTLKEHNTNVAKYF